MELLVLLGLPTILGVLVAEFVLVCRLDRAKRPKPQPGVDGEALTTDPAPVLEPGTHAAALAEVPESIRHHFEFPWPLK
jgi:hypothetical protein